MVLAPEANKARSCQYDLATGGKCGEKGGVMIYLQGVFAFLGNKIEDSSGLSRSWLLVVTP